MRHELVCLGPGSPPRLALRESALPPLAAGQVRVRVEACAVNPIDAKRALGYGQRLLGLKGAGRFPLVLGNDLAGRVEALGPGVSGLRPGQRVFGLLATGRHGGSHASQVHVPQAWLRPAPAHADAAHLAVLPYTFTTLWRALRALGLQPPGARGKRVLILGAAGGLGRLALFWLSGWGCHTTAVCAADQAGDCLALGASEVVARGPGAVASLRPDFDAALNFASWDEEPALASRLGPQALGLASTVHPLLGHFDRLGWLRGALASRRDWQRLQAMVRERAPRARYAWTLFQPEPEALDALTAGLPAQRVLLPVGLSVALAQADQAFAHLAHGAPGRAVLRP